MSADRGLGWRERVGTRGWRTHLRESGGEVANRGRRQGILGTWGILRSLTELEEFRVGDFPGGPVVESPLPLQGARARSLVREIRSFMPHIAAKKKKKKKNLG